MKAKTPTSVDEIPVPEPKPERVNAYGHSIACEFNSLYLHAFTVTTARVVERGIALQGLALGPVAFWLPAKLIASAMFEA